MMESNLARALLAQLRRMPNATPAKLLGIQAPAGRRPEGEGQGAVTILDSIEQILRVVSYVATPIIAGAALWIARQQAQINRRKLEIDRYERRLLIYGEVTKIISVVVQGGGTDLDSRSL